MIYWDFKLRSFRGSYGKVCERVYRFNSTEINKEEREMCEFEMDFKKSFCPRSNRSNHTGNDDIISQRPDLKTGVKNGIFWS